MNVRKLRLFAGLLITMLVIWGCGSSGGGSDSSEQGMDNGSIAPGDENGNDFDDSSTTDDANDMDNSNSMDDSSTTDDSYNMDDSTSMDDSDTGDDEDPVEVFNNPPDTEIINKPPASFYGAHFLNFTWRGTDSDGYVVSYKYRISGAQETNGWVETAETAIRNDYCARNNGEYTFQVVAIDNLGLMDPTPAEYKFMVTGCSS